MNISKNGLLFIFSGSIIALCLIVTIVLVGMKDNYLLKKQKPKTEQSKEPSDSVQKSDISAQSHSKRKNEETVEEFQIPPVSTIEFSHPSEDIQEKIASLRLEDKIAQMFLTTPDTLTGVTDATLAGETTKNALTAHTVGGLVYGKGNLINKEQVRLLLDKTNSYSEEIVDLPLFLAIEDFGGDSSPITSTEELGIAKGSAPSELEALPVKDSFIRGGDIGRYLKDLGFNMNLAPSAAMSSDSYSFGKDPTTVSDKCLAFYSGLHSQNILGVYKDFPGKDDFIQLDSGVLSSQNDTTDLKSGSLIPYNKGLDNSAVIMLNNLAYPELTSSVAPAFMSHKMVTDLLRNELDYKGIVITPALDTEEGFAEFTVAEMSVQAIEAGCDMIYAPKDFQEAYQAVLNAVQSHRISEDRIDESLVRILAVKESLY